MPAWMSKATAWSRAAGISSGDSRCQLPRHVKGSQSTEGTAMVIGLVSWRGSLKVTRQYSSTACWRTGTPVTTLLRMLCAKKLWAPRNLPLFFMAILNF